MITLEMLEEKRKEFEEMLEGYKKQEEQKSKVNKNTDWLDIEKMQENDVYYYKAHNGITKKDNYEYINWETSLIKRGLAFKTEDKLEEIDSIQQLYRDMRRFADENNTKLDDILMDINEVKYYMTYDLYDNEIDVDSTFGVINVNEVYFDSKELCRKAIEIFGDRYKEILGVE